jgi:hypothetical protein
VSPSRMGLEICHLESRPKASARLDLEVPAGCASPFSHALCGGQALLASTPHWHPTPSLPPSLAPTHARAHRAAGTQARVPTDLTLQRLTAWSISPAGVHDDAGAHAAHVGASAVARHHRRGAQEPRRLQRRHRARTQQEPGHRHAGRMHSGTGIAPCWLVGLKATNGLASSRVSPLSLSHTGTDDADGREPVGPHGRRRTQGGGHTPDEPTEHGVLRWSVV